MSKIIDIDGKKATAYKQLSTVTQSTEESTTSPEEDENDLNGASSDS